MKIKRRNRKYDFRTREGKAGRAELAMLLLKQEIKQTMEAWQRRLNEIGDYLLSKKKKKG